MSVYVSQAYTPIRPAHSGVVVVAVAAPILAPDGRMLGVLAVEYSLEAIQKLASQAAKAQDIQLLITDQAGVLVAGPRQALPALTSVRENPRVAARWTAGPCSPRTSAASTGRRCSRPRSPSRASAGR